MKNKNEKANFGITIFLFLLAIILLAFSVKQQIDSQKEKGKLSQEISEKVSEEVCKVVEQSFSKSSEFPDHEAYRSLSEKVILVQNQQSHVTKDYERVGEISGKLLVTGKFRRGYLFINASVDNGKPLTVYDSIYITLNNKGGHLLRNKSLSVPASDTTQLLYDLRDISYITSVPYSENKQPLFVDWLGELNSGKDVLFYYSFLSSWREGGLIKEITIAYECEEGSQCEIKIE